ncbi:MAG: RHS repeat domain-containing protein [Candidatus Bathyarchaeia archaeon]
MAEEPEIPWTQYDQAYKRIHDAILSDLTAAPSRKRVTKVIFIYDESGNISEIHYYQGDTFLFALQFSYDSQGRLSEVTRVE